MLHRRIAVLLLVVGSMVWAYGAWSLHRLSAATTDPNWPRQFPYPDGWMHDRMERYALRDSATGQLIGYTADAWSLVLRDGIWLAYGGAMAGALGAIILFASFMYHRFGSRRRGFDVVLRKQGDAS